jgi:hypothetical protein
LGNAAERQKYTKIMDEYTKKYEKNMKELKEWVPIIGKDKRITSIADSNMKNSELLSIIGINYALEECK